MVEIRAIQHPSFLAVPLRRAFSAAVSTLFSFEALFVLYLFAGRYKGDPRFRWVPVDLTALFFGLSVMAGMYVLARRGFKVRRKAFVLVLLALAFVGYVLLSLTWTPGRSYAQQKALYIATLTLWPLIACAILIVRDRHRLRRFLVLTLLFSMWVAIESTLAYFRSTGEHLSVFALGGSYLGSGRTVGLGVLIALAYRLFFAHSRFQKVAATALTGYYGFVLLILGGRGPFLAALLGASVPLLVGIRVSISGKVFLRRYTILLIALGIVLVITAISMLERGMATVTLRRLLESSREGSTAVRLRLFAEAIDLWSEASLFGHGIGAFPILAGFGDIRSYPHNLILEILAELGLGGLFLFSAIVIYALRALGPLSIIRRDPLRILLLMLFANVFFNAMVSGDIPDNRIVFAVLGLMTLPKGGKSG